MSVIWILKPLFTNFEKTTLTMETASFNGFIKTLFYLIAFYFIVRFLARIFLPVLVKKAVEKAGESFTQHHERQFRQQQQDLQNEKVTVERAKAAKQPSSKNVGEYIDYEEIK